MIWVLISVIVILLIALISAIVGLYHKNTNGVCKSKRRLEGKTAVVTGGTLGMGLEIAIDFADRGAKVIIACPFKNEGETAEKLIRNQTRNDKVYFKILDLASFASVKEFATDILKNEERLDILVNNAGIGKPPKNHKHSADGLNFLLRVNYFGHFLLTLLLLPLLKESGSPNDKSRIVNTSSILHRAARIDPTNLNKVTFLLWLPAQDYSNSKALLILFTKELAKRLKDSNVVVNSLEPGAVGSTIFLSLGKVGYIFTYMYKFLAKNVWEGAQTAIFVSVDENAGKMSGEHFKDCKVSTPRRLVRDEKLAKKVWEESIRLVNLSEKHEIL